MRKLIIIFSILFFILSGLIKIKEAGISAPPTVPHNELHEIVPNAISPNVEKETEKITTEQAENQIQVEELQALVANLETRLSNKEEELQGNIELKESKKAERILAVLGGGSFLSGQIVVNEELMNTVNRIVPDILASPDHRLVIEGHTDNIPIRSFVGRGYKDNVELAFLRAKAVAGILVKNDIPLDQIFVVSFGDTRPIASNETPEGRASNRRVVIKLVP